MTETRLKVNMHCASCAATIDKKLKKMGCESESNPALKIVKVKHDKSISTDDIIKAIKDIGYDARED